MLYYRFYMLYVHFSAKGNRISFISLRNCIKKSGTSLLLFCFQGSSKAHKSRTCNTKSTPYVKGADRLHP